MEQLNPKAGHPEKLAKECVDRINLRLITRIVVPSERLKTRIMEQEIEKSIREAIKWWTA